MKTTFDNQRVRLWGLAGLGLLFLPVLVRAGNEQLVEKKATELKSVGDQVARQAAPAGLKDGQTVEVRASLRVEHPPGREPVVRDVQVKAVAVDGQPAAVSAMPVAPPAAAPAKPEGAVKDAVKPAAGNGGRKASGQIREEPLDVPAVNDQAKE